MEMQRSIRILVTGIFITTCAACAPSSSEGSGEDADNSAGAVARELPTRAELPSGTLQAKVIEIASSDDLADAVDASDTVYIHTADDGVWYFKSGNYLLGIESFTQYHRKLDAWVDLDTGSKVAPMQARVVGHSYRGQGWDLPKEGRWPVSANSVWVIGTEGGFFGMGGAPQGMPLGTEVFGSMQTYGGALSTPYLFADGSPSYDSDRIQALFNFGSDTLLGGHSAGSSTARRLALDLGLTNVWLYGTPNYSRESGEYTTIETSEATMVAQVINNNDDPVTNCLSSPINLVSLAWGTVKCHNYSNWDYTATSPVEATCE